MRCVRIYAVLFGLGLIVFGATSAGRLAKRSSDPHFIFQAHAWLNGRLSIDPLPKGADDAARVETVALQDGSIVRGRRMVTRRSFRTTRGSEISLSQIQRSLRIDHYVSFPSFPAVIMIPQVLLFGKSANDVTTTVLLAALVLPLMFSVLRRLSQLGLSKRSQTDNLLLTITLAFGSVFFFSAVQGRVWYTAHVLGVVLCLCYVWFSLEARHPLAAGICLGFAALTRTPMAFMFPLFAFEAWRMYRANDPKKLAKTWMLFALPIFVIAAFALLHNVARFDQFHEFGHRYLAVRQQEHMEIGGLFSPGYLLRNLHAALLLRPDLKASTPYMAINGHGLAIWFTTPLLILLLVRRRSSPLYRSLWITVALVALPSLLYQNTGWFQFGYRFSLDYIVFLLLLIALGRQPLTAKLSTGLIAIGIAVNLFGAVTFARFPGYYRADASAYQLLIDK